MDSAKLTRLLVLVHRWLGIVLCLMFALWFASGAVLMYVPFPALSESERLAHLALIDLSKVDISPEKALADSELTAPDRLRMIERPDGPVYVVHPATGSVVAVNARTGGRTALVTSVEATQIAAQFSGGKVGVVEGPLDYDQRIVHQRFDSYRPFLRVSLDDDRGTVLYISTRSGDVLQETYRRQRLWNYVGAVVHWIYPTFLRKSWAVWDNVVWWLSLIGIVMTLAGIWLGIARSNKSLRNPRKTSISPFKQWFRWHHIAGLSVGLFLLTWIFSGWLSMDHGRLFSSGFASADQLARYRGIPVADGAKQVSLAEFSTLGPVAEAEIITVAGDAYLVGRRSGADPVSIRQSSNGQAAGTTNALPDSVLQKAVQAAWPDVPVKAIGRIEPGDQYSHLIYEPLPSATRRVVLGDAPPTWIHIDATSGRIIQVMDRSRRVYRWLFSGLHSFDVPGLTAAPAVRQSLMLVLLAMGFLLSITGAVIGIKRLQKNRALT